MTTSEPEPIQNQERIRINLQPLRDFVAQNDSSPMASRARLDIGPIDLYVRMTTRVLGTKWGKTLDLADITIPTELQGRKLFSVLLENFEQLAVKYNRAVYVESIVNPIIRGALERRGYTFTDGPLGSAWKEASALRRDYNPSPEI